MIPIKEKIITYKNNSIKSLLDLHKTKYNHLEIANNNRKNHFRYIQLDDILILLENNVERYIYVDLSGYIDYG